MRRSPSVMLLAMSPEKRNTSCKTKSEMAAQLLFVPLADVDAVDQNRAALDVVEAAKRRDDRGLAAAGGADESDFFSRGARERKSL